MAFFKIFYTMLGGPLYTVFTSCLPTTGHVADYDSPVNRQPDTPGTAGAQWIRRSREPLRRSAVVGHVGGGMDRKLLSPAAYLDLKIQLDKVAALQSQCGEALCRLMDGKVSRDDYMGLLDRQAQAQRAWQKLHEKYFTPRRG